MKVTSTIVLVLFSVILLSTKQSPAQILYQNGTHYSHQGTGVNGSDESVLQHSIGMIAFGWGMPIAEDFTVPAGKTWDISRFDFYGLQANSPPLPQILTAHFQIWNGAPGLAGSSVIFGDMTTNRWLFSGFANAYRVNEGFNTSTHPIMGTAARPIDPLILGPGNYWVEFEMYTPNTFDVSAIPITIPNQSTTGNARGQNFQGIWGDIRDPGTNTQSGFPITVYGTEGILPVELEFFDVKTGNGEVFLSWATLSETNNAGFEIESVIEGRSSTHAFVSGQGNSTERESYEYVISDLEPGVYQFRLKQIDFDGSHSFSPLVEAKILAPDGFHVGEAFPNPFEYTSQFDLLVNNDQSVTVKLFDTQGKVLRTLFEGMLDAGVKKRIDIAGGDLPNGSYLIRVKGLDFVSSKLILLMK